MALPNGAGGYQVGAGNRQETIMGAMAALRQLRLLQP